MSSRVLELLDLIARWVHLTAGIMWVGNSLLFNWIDHTLTRPGSAAKDLIGETWLLHSGGFYYLEKTSLDGRPLPAVLHWFKWQAYTTWMSGAALLLVVYWVGGRAAMTDPLVASLTHAQAVGIGVGAIVTGWATYELVHRLVAPRTAAVAKLLLLVGFIAIVYALTHLLSGRAAFLHVGAMLGTIMAGNVFFTIVPSQRELVKSVETGGVADATISARAKRVSINNNYFTFPVLALMVSGHFASITGHPLNWILLLLIAVIGATVRHILNIRFAWRRWRGALATTLALGAASIYAMLAWAPSRAGTAAVSAAIPEHVTFEDARHVIDRRCAACHSAQPSDSSYGGAPVGVMFDTRAQMEAMIPRIRERAVVTRTMPPANKTHITDAERAVLDAWTQRR